MAAILSRPQCVKRHHEDSGYSHASSRNVHTQMTLTTPYKKLAKIIVDQIHGIWHLYYKRVQHSSGKPIQNIKTRDLSVYQASWIVRLWSLRFSHKGNCMSINAGWQHMGWVPHPNYVDPECCVSTVCHQVRFMYWEHLGHFQRAICHLKWHKIVCMRYLACTFNQMKSTDIFSMYLQSGVPRHFIWWFIAGWT